MLPSIKEKMIDVIISCDAKTTGVISCAKMSPSSSIEDISEYIAMYIHNVQSACLRGTQVGDDECVRNFG